SRCKPRRDRRRESRAWGWRTTHGDFFPRLLGREFQDRLNDPRLVVSVQVVVKGQADQAGADVLGYGALLAIGRNPPPHFREVQGKVVENAEDGALLQMRDQPLALF